MIVKPWGTSLKLYEGDDYALYHLRMLKGGYSSLHKHINMVNKFVLLSGSVDVDVHPSENDLSYKVTYKLEPWKPLTINLNVLHRFIANAESIVYEVYTSKLSVDDNDIIRLDSNGMK